MPNRHVFHPDWASNPGDTIRYILAERQISVVALGERLGRTRESLDELLEGRAPITPGIAARLSEVLGGSVAFWLNRDAQYRAHLSYLARQGHSAKPGSWLSELPITDMTRFGWISANPASHEARAAACLRFFGVGDVSALRERYRDILQRSKFRTSSSFESEPGAVAAWLRQGEIEGETIECDPWAPHRFATLLEELRGLTRMKDPHDFLPELQRRCSTCGVAVVVVRSPAGCRASGATRFVSETKALLMLSFRYLSDDQFWFSFFHEAGHLALHDKATLFLEGIEGAGAMKEENEANAFAARLLIPEPFRAELPHLRYSAKDIIRFARRIGISPGIVVGQLQHRGRVKRSHLNRLKRRFQWEE
jgi:HTH-type transcriptional regulator/antitoxin HigA